jgi:hypothetical protein
VKCCNLPKVHLLYCNFCKYTFPSERVGVYDRFSKESYCYCSEKVNYDRYVEDLASSKFVLSPRGNGLDTHRLWETLYVGSYPIVKSSSLDALYEGLPIVIVDDWSEVTEEFLNAKYEEMEAKTFSFDKLYSDFWYQTISQK